MTVLAELLVRHTRRHMPTRRVAVEAAYLPTNGAGHGRALLEGIASEVTAGLDDDDRPEVHRLLDATRAGAITVPRIALRHRLQTDFHGLARSRHRVVEEPNGLITLELDVHGPALPQLLAALLAASQLPRSGRLAAADALARGAAHPGRRPVGYGLRIVTVGSGATWPLDAPPGAATPAAVPHPWAGIATERRWALEVLGLTDPVAPTAREVQRRFRRLLRAAHPDHGGGAAEAAERIDSLREARAILLDWHAALDPDADLAS